MRRAGVYSVVRTRPHHLAATRTAARGTAPRLAAGALPLDGGPTAAWWFAPRYARSAVNQAAVRATVGATTVGATMCHVGITDCAPVVRAVVNCRSVGAGASGLKRRASACR